MRQRQYAREILNSVEDLGRAKAFVDLYRHDGFDMNHRFGVMGRPLVNRVARLRKVSEPQKEELMRMLMYEGASIYLAPRIGRENTYKRIQRTLGPDHPVAKRFKETHRFVMSVADC